MTQALAKTGGALAVQQMASIFSLETELLKLPQADITIEHYHAKGLYGRKMCVPKNVTLTGAIHKSEHFCMLLQGEVSVASNGEIIRMRAPYMFVSQPGTKRAIHAFEDSIWLNVHKTDETDLDKIENELFTNDLNALEIT